MIIFVYMFNARSGVREYGPAGRRRNAMKRLVIAAIMALVLMPGCSKFKADEYAMITFMIGDVTKNNSMVQIGDLVKEKDVIQTGADSICDVKIGESLIRVKQKTSVILSSLIKTAQAENTEIELNAGKLLCKPKKLIKSESFLVKTPTAVAGVRGTQFSVEADANGTSRIKVFEGSVRVARRIKRLDDRVNRILNMAAEIGKEEKVVITKKDVERAEKLVDALLKKEPRPGDEIALNSVADRAGKDIAVSTKSVDKFLLDDYAKDSKEIIDIKPRRKEVIQELNRVIEEEIEAPKPNGRLLVTNFEVYFIKNGKVEWEGKIVEEPVKRDNKIYVVSGDQVFCASVRGPVFWRKQIENDGKIRVLKNRIIVMSQGQQVSLDSDTGEKL